MEDNSVGLGLGLLRLNELLPIVHQVMGLIVQQAVERNPVNPATHHFRHLLQMDRLQ
jgi:hypothetical protein